MIRFVFSSPHYVSGNLISSINCDDDMSSSFGSTGTYSEGANFSDSLKFAHHIVSDIKNHINDMSFLFLLGKKYNISKIEIV